MNSATEIQFDLSRRIKDIKSPYVVKIFNSSDLVKEFGIYAEKYFNAAHRVASFLICEGKVDTLQLDTFIFPLAFLYRHSIELFLKGIAFQSIVDNDLRSLFLKTTCHNLSTILEEVLKVSPCRYWPQKAEIAWVQAYFKSISEIDKASDSFRYPFHVIRQEDNQYYIEKVFEEQTDIDLVKFANKFEAAIEILKHWYFKEVFEATEWNGLNPVFIEKGGSYYEKSVVGYSYDKKGYFPYSNGYREVAEFLFDDFKKNSHEDMSVAENYFFPMCYLYRNGVELALKSLWMDEIRVDLQEKITFLNKYKHKILKLWRVIYKNIMPFYDREGVDLPGLERCLEALNNFDGEANVFRYPCRKDMTLYFAKETKFDFYNIAVMMESLIRAVDGIGSDISLWNEFCACDY